MNLERKKSKAEVVQKKDGRRRMRGMAGGGSGDLGLRFE